MVGTTYATTAEAVATTADIGLNSESTRQVVGLLQRLLADEHILYMRLRNYHWNVVGPHFGSLHELFQAQYTAIEAVIDAVAERVRSLGAPAVIGTLTEMLQQTTLIEKPGVYPEASQMIADLVADHEAIIRLLRRDVQLTADTYGDMGTSDALTGFMEQHEKLAWLLRAHLERRA
jgi:starvation-inducible DNA-binding protein